MNWNMFGGLHTVIFLSSIIVFVGCLMELVAIVAVQYRIDIISYLYSEQSLEGKRERGYANAKEGFMRRKFAIFPQGAEYFSICRNPFILPIKLLCKFLEIIRFQILAILIWVQTGVDKLVSIKKQIPRHKIENINS